MAFGCSAKKKKTISMWDLPISSLQKLHRLILSDLNATFLTLFYFMKCEIDYLFFFFFLNEINLIKLSFRPKNE